MRRAALAAMENGFVTAVSAVGDEPDKSAMIPADGVIAEVIPPRDRANDACHGR